jgi:ActR/RegA family two-component response regulator/two-component sensor histidine kinase
MKPKSQRPKLSLLHEEVPDHVLEYMQLTRLAEMGRMAAGIAHEINTPLMIIQGFSENLEILMSQDNPPLEDMRLHVLEIAKTCQRISRIVNKMNRMSRSQKLRLHVVDLAEVALNVVDFIKTRIADSEVRLEFDFDKPLPIRCDVVQVEQIILNVIANAISSLEAVKENRRIRISFDEVGPWQQLKVWNNGPEIPADIQSKIMAPFFSTKDNQGSGLGLPVSKAIMEVHGGDLSFNSRAEMGTEFILSFPRPDKNPWQTRELKERGTVFIIDPQANYRVTLAEKFRLLGFKVEAYQHFSEGFNAISHSTSIAGVLVDLIPGQKEGLQMVKKLRRHLGPKGLIFAVSHYPSALDAKASLKAAGVTESFEKPLHADNFDLILRLLDSPALDAPIKKAT